MTANSPAPQTTDLDSQQTGDPRPTPLPAPLSLWLWVMLAFALLSSLVVAYEIKHTEFHEISALPHRFDDFMVFWRRLPLLHQEAFFSAPDGDRFGSRWGYPAPALWIYRFFYLFNPPGAVHPTRSFALMELVTLSGVLVAALLFLRAVLRAGLLLAPALALTLVATLLSWPLLFAIQRGNIELLLWLPLAAALHAFHRRHFTLAAALIGIAASAKIYPLILLALFLPARRFLQIALATALTVAITLLSLWYVGPTLPFAIDHLGLGVSGFLQSHGEGLNWRTEGFNHSLFHLLKIAVATHGDAASLPHLLPLYMAAAALLMTLVYFLRVIHLPVLNQLTVLTIAMVYLPATSYDYTLEILLLPWAWLALLLIERSSRHRAPLRGATLAMLLFALILAPELFLLRGVYCHSGTLKSLCLGALLALACITPWPISDDPQPQPANAI